MHLEQECGAIEGPASSLDYHLDKGLRFIGLQLPYPSGPLMRCCQRNWKQKMRLL